MTAQSNINTHGNGTINATGTITGGGDLNVNDGTFQAVQGNYDTLGGSINVASGGTFEISGGGASTGPNINIVGDGHNGAGALHSSGGNNVVNNQVNVIGTTINSSSPGDTLTLNNLALGGFANVTFAGDGDTVVNNGFGNGAGPTLINDALLHVGYHSDLPRDTNNNNPTVQQHNLHNNQVGSHMNGGGARALTANGFDLNTDALFAHPNFNGLDLLTDGPGNRGLDFNNDGDFTSTPAIGRGDDYQNMWIGTLTVSGADAGNWTFRRAGDDDRAVIWLDLDQDGIFESTDGVLNTGGGTNGELLTFENGGTKTVNLAAGDYLFAAGHTEFGGGSNIDIRISTPNLAEEVLKPSDPDQAGFWSALVTPDNNVTKTGAGTTTFNGANTYDGITSIQGGTLIAANDSALGLADGTAATGTSVGSGATLGIQGNVNIGNEHITLDSNATIQNFGGNNTIGTQTITVADTPGAGSPADQVTINSGSAGDTLSIGGSGSMNLGFSQLRATGAGETTITQDISAQNTGINTLATINVFTGLEAFAYDVTGNNNDNRVRDIGLDANNVSGNSLLQESPISRILIDGTNIIRYDNDNDFRNGDTNHPSKGFSNSLDGLPGLNQNDNFGTSFHATLTIPDKNGDGTAYDVEFGTQRADNGVAVYVDFDGDGNFETSQGERLVSRGCCGSQFTTFNVLPGTYDFLAAHIEGGGGSAFEPTIDLFDGNGRQTINGNITFASGFASPTQFHVVKDDAGLLRVGTPDQTTPNGLLQFNGGVDLNAGILTINADNSAGGTPTGSWEVASGATLGGHGTIVLAPGESVNVAATPGIISPGDAGTGYTPVPGGDATYSFGQDAATVGTLTISGTAGSTTLDMGGILQLDLVNPTTFDQLVVSPGTLDFGSSSILEINGSDVFTDLDLAPFDGEILDLVVADDFNGIFSNVAPILDDVQSTDDDVPFLFAFDEDTGNFQLLVGSAAAIPEPATIALWSLLGLIGVGYHVRRRRKAA